MRLCYTIWDFTIISDSVIISDSYTIADLYQTLLYRLVIVSNFTSMKSQAQVHACILHKIINNDHTTQLIINNGHTTHQLIINNGHTTHQLIAPSQTFPL